MLFHTIDFAVFLPIVFVLYWFVTAKNLKLQNWLIVIASYVFYGWWDWRFLSLLLFSTFTDYLVGLKLGNEKSPRKRKLVLWVSILINLGSSCDAQLNRSIFGKPKNQFNVLLLCERKEIEKSIL